MSSREPIHLRPATELADRVLLPGDPHRALAVAQAVLADPLMFNHARGLWGYTGRARDGAPLSVQATGMGGPSAAIVIEELIGLGARTLIRIGTCAAVVPGIGLGELVAAEDVVAADGTSAALGVEEERLEAEPGLTAALVAAGARPVTAISTDLFYDPRPQPVWETTGAEVVEMEAATLLALARRHDVAAAVLLAVTDDLVGERRRVEREQLEQLGVQLGEMAWSALANQA